MGRYSFTSSTQPLSLMMLALQVSLISAIMWVRQHRKPWKKSKSKKSRRRAHPGEERTFSQADREAKKWKVSQETSTQGETLNTELGAPLASMDSLGSLASTSRSSSSSPGSMLTKTSMDSLQHRNSCLMGSLSGDTSIYSFPEPWPGAIAELAALKCTERPQSTEAVKKREQEPGPALGQDFLLEVPEGTKQEEVPRDRGDLAKSPVGVDIPCSMVTEEHLWKCCKAARTAQVLSKRLSKELKAELSRDQRAFWACGGALPGEPSVSPSWMEVQEHPELLGNRMQSQWPSPREARRNLSGEKKYSPTEWGISTPAAPSQSTPAECSGQRQVPAGRECARDASELGSKGHWMKKGCSWLWCCMKAWGKRCFCFCLPSDMEL
ncbi:uncharacterized protein [Heliangelus exortis]|uniref:uncharacterized protein isoform X2 n=1 Tax=Heliangelus exortis TaxID=472823 RepID=UPI003A916C6B